MSREYVEVTCSGRADPRRHARGAESAASVAGVALALGPWVCVLSVCP